MANHLSREPRRQMGLAWVGSVIVHAVAIVLLANVPRPPQHLAGDPFASIEVFDVSPMEFEPTGSDEPPLAEPEDEAPTSESTPPDQRGMPKTPAAAPDRGDSTPRQVERSPVSDGAPRADALALGGLRGRSGEAGTFSGTSAGPSELVPNLDIGSYLRKVAPSRPRVEHRDDTDRSPSLSEAGFKPKKDGTYVYRSPNYPFRAKLHPSGRIEFKTFPVKVRGFMVKPLGISEAVRAAQGKTLFRRAKQKILRETFELRLNMAIAWAKKHMESRLARIYRDLFTLWQNEQRSARQRRHDLFQYWDGCEDSLTVQLEDFDGAETAKLDEARANGGQRARSRVIQFVSTHLPADSPDAYPRAEIDRLNTKRKSRERFVPYHRDAESDEKDRPNEAAVRSSGGDTAGSSREP